MENRDPEYTRGEIAFWVFWVVVVSLMIVNSFVFS